MTLFDSLEPAVGGNVEPLVVIRMGGAPVGKGRPRGRIVKPRSGGEFISFYTDSSTRNFENNLRAVAFDVMHGRPLLDGPLAVILFAYFAIPESWTKAKRHGALNGTIRPIGRPDADNLIKSALDALNPYRDPRTKIKVPVVWRDDSCVVDGRVVKLYAKKTPGIIIEIRRAGEPPKPYTVDNSSAD